MSTTGDNDDLKAPSYAELFTLVQTLRDEVKTLSLREKESVPSNVGANRENEKNDTFDRVTEFRIAPDLNKTIKEFNGRESTFEAGDWIKSVEGLANLNGWPLNVRLQFIRSNLVGAARNWFLGRNFKNWAEFLLKFRSTFVRELRITDKWNAMYCRTQQRNECLMDFFQEKVRLCRDLGLNVSETKDHVLQSLFNRDMALYALSKCHIDEDGLLTDLLNWERLNHLRSERMRKTERIFNTPVQYKSAPMTVDHNRDEANQNRNPNKWPRASWRSSGLQATNSTNAGNRVEHKVEYMTFNRNRSEKPRKCFKCSLEGHMARDCPTSAEVTVINNNKNGRHNYIKEITINDQLATVNGLIDTGSDFSFIKGSVVSKYKLPVIPKTINFKVFGNSQCMVSGGETTAVVKIDEVKEPLKFMVVDDDKQNYDIIIGRNFTDLEGVTFVKTINGLHFGYGMEFPFGKEEINQGMEVESQEVLIVQNDSVPKEITMDMVNYNASFNQKQVNELINLLNEFRICFAFSLQELGCTNYLTMDIVDTNLPVVSKPYRVSASERRTIDSIVQEWKNEGLVTETKSPYASPVLLVPKKDGEQRLVIDYRRLNAQTVKKIFPTPNLDDQLEALCGSTLFTTLDLSAGYLQVPLTDAAKEKTAFITPTETGQFERMVFGLANAPYEFCKLMQQVMGHLRNTVAVWYMDDILVPALDFDDMMRRLRLVFTELKKAKLTLKLRKCHFGCEKVSYLGFNISSDGIKPGRNKLEAVKDFPTPKSKHDVRRFLGLTGFFRRFICKYAEKAKPISDLLKKETVYVWENEQEEAFQQLKCALTEEPTLKLYDPYAVTEVHCDASSIGVSGMLLQQDADGKLRLVHAVSKKTTDAESKYHSSRLELMAIVWTLIKLRHLLIGIQFVVVTDCQALVHMNSKKTTNPQIARWASLLSEFNFEVRHRPGEAMQHVDALSRAPVDPSTGETMDEIISDKMEVLVTMSEEEYVVAVQNSDTELKNIIAELASEAPSLAVKSKYEMINGILYRIVVQNGEEKKLWMVPKSMRKSLVIKFHDMSGHFSVDRTVSKILEKYYFPRLRRYVKHHINMCGACVLNKVPRGKQPGKLHPIEPGKRPFETIHIDHLGPFPTSTKKNNYLLVLTDNLTKFVKIFPARSVHTKGVISHLQAFTLQFGLPRRIICDRGTAFTSEQFQKYCHEEGIELHLGSIRHPQTNGQCERANSSILTAITTGTDKETSWDQKLPEVEFMLNNMFNKTTGKSPFQALYGYSPMLQDGLLDKLVSVTTLMEDPVETQAKIRGTIAEAQKQWKQRYDKQKVETKYQVGEIVFLRCPPVRTGTSTKLQQKYRGPLVVTKVCNGDTYKIAAVRPTHRRLYATTAHVSLLKPFNNQTEVDDSTEEESEPEEVERGSRLRRNIKTPSKFRDFVM